jgi:hypothetical protein
MANILREYPLALTVRQLPQCGTLYHTLVLELQLERSIASGTPSRSSCTILRTAIQLSMAIEGLEMRV